MNSSKTKPSSPATAKEEAPSRPKYAVPAVDKALDVLELLSAQAVPMTQAQIARALGREASELFRLLGALEARGYLRRDTSGAYVLTLKLFELSRTHSPHEQLMQAAALPMREFAEQARESCHLSILHRDQVLVLAQVDGPMPLRLSVESGTLHSVVETISGQVLLANSSPQERETILATRAEYLRLSAPERDGFLERLDRIRRDGWAYAEGLRFIGGRDLGVPVGAPGAHTRAVLTVASLKGKYGLEDLFDILPQLQRCAADIARLAGIAAG